MSTIARGEAIRVAVFSGLVTVLFWLMPPSVAGASARVQFSPAATEWRGGDPTVADFNGDGKPDLVATAPGEVAVHLNDGRGRLMTRVATPLSGNPTVEASGDFNRDGKADLAVTRYTAYLDPVALVLLGDGTGGFPTVKSVSVGPFLSMAVADFNRDGKLDLVGGGLCWPAEAGPNLLLGDGTGAFRPLDTSCAGYVPSLAVADFNRDGAPDVARAATYGGALVLLGDGRGHFSPVRDVGVPNEPLSVIATADLNRDGRPDLAIQYGTTHDAGNQESGTAIFLGNPRGRFRRVSTLRETDYQGHLTGARTAVQSVVGDFNGDGTPDLVGSTWSARGRSAGVLAGDGKGHFKRVATSGLASGASAVADFNGDAKPDLVAGPRLLLNVTRFSPLVATGRARHVTARSARLRGTVNPRGNATRYRFSYGRTRRYSRTTRWRDAGSAKRKLTVAMRVAHLRRGTRYHYRLIARNREGTMRGRDRTIRTRP